MNNRTLAASALLLLGALALAGCATTPGGAAVPPAASEEPPSDQAPADDSELEAAWLNASSIALVTYGSSSCLPIVGEVTGDGQSVTVSLTDPEDAVCTMDYSPRASFIPLPTGLDAAQEVEIVVTGDYRGDVDLDGIEGEVPPASGEEFDMQPAAGWFDDAGIVLLTYGSSSCPPVFASVGIGADGAVEAVVAEPVPDQVCTADMAPQLSVLHIDGVDDDTRPAELSLVAPGTDPVRIPILG